MVSSDQGATYATKASGIVKNFETDNANMLYDQKHYPVNEFSWDAPGEIYNVADGDIDGVSAGIYAREEHNSSTSLEEAVLDDTTTQVKIVPVT